MSIHSEVVQVSRDIAENPPYLLHGEAELQPHNLSGKSVHGRFYYWLHNHKIEGDALHTHSVQTFIPY